MKRIINLLFAIVFALPLYSQEIATIDGIKYFLYNGEATIMEQDNPVSGSIVIPEIVSYNNNSYVVVSIADRAFREKYYPQGWRFFPKTGGLTLLSRQIPELPLRPERK